PEMTCLATGHTALVCSPRILQLLRDLVELFPCFLRRLGLLAGRPFIVSTRTSALRSTGRIVRRTGVAIPTRRRLLVTTLLGMVLLLVVARRTTARGFE